MADQFIQVPPNSTGLKVDASELTVNAQTVERQRIVIGDPTSATALAGVDAGGNLYVDIRDAGGDAISIKAASTAALAGDTSLVVSISPNSGTAKGTQPTTALAVQDLKDSGRTFFSMYCDDITGVTSEALLSCSTNKAGTVTTAQTSYTVTAGKTLRITAFTAYIKGTTTTAAGAKIRIRQASASISASSPVIASLGVGMPAAVATASNGNVVEFGDGLEVAGGQQVAMSQLATSASSAVSGLFVGFEY